MFSPFKSACCNITEILLKINRSCDKYQKMKKIIMYVRVPGFLQLMASVMVFNTTFNNISVISWLSFICGGNWSMEKTTDLPQVTDKLYHIMLYWVRVLKTGGLDPAMNGIQTHNLSPLSKIGSLLNNNKIITTVEYTNKNISFIGNISNNLICLD